MRIILGLAAIFLLLKIVAFFHSEDGNIDDGNPYLTLCAGEDHTTSVYERGLKPILDSVISFFGLVILSPVFLLIAVLLYIDDPGDIFFHQKRVGKDGRFFSIHKFRTMKMNTPHDLPTHLLENPDSYITRVGKILRRTSLDELPQIWDIFRGKMAIIGPRPALYNQDDLIAERAKYNANTVVPGLTGWAQVNGRDELTIEVKSRFDGDYTAEIKKGGFKAFRMDVRCFFMTIGKVIKADGIQEGKQ